MATAVLAVSLLLQLVAAGLALRLARITGRRAAWIVIALAIALMAARRGVTLIDLVGEGGDADLPSELIALAISLLMVVGIALVGPVLGSMRAAQDALGESEGRYRALFEHSPSAVIESDWSAARAALAALPGGVPTAEELAARPELVAACVEQVRIVAFNRAAMALFDARDEDEQRLRDVIGGLADVEQYALTLAAIGEGRRSFHLEASIRTLTGRRRSVTVTWTVPPGYERSYARLFVNLVDTTERKEIEAQLMVADRMAALGTLAAGVAHEINNPLTYVYGNLQLLEDRLVWNPDAGPLIRDALEGATRVRDIVRDLQSFTHGSGVAGGPIPLRPVVDSALRMAEHELRHRARLVCEVPPSLYVAGEATRLGQVLVNLLVNAAQAIPAGNAEQHVVAVRAAVAGEQVEITVSDTGVGIPRELVAHVFEPFVTTKAPGGGCGLGLYLCHNILRSLGGDIEVARTSHEGTTIRVSLPRVDGVAPTRPEPQETAQASSRQRLAILVADDEPGVVAMLSHLLARHDVTPASSGREAIAALERRAFDLVLCDVMMPDLTGMDVHAHVAAHAPELLDRLVFLTGGAFTDEARAFLEAPERRCLTKPFSPGDVRAIIASLTPSAPAREAHASSG